ncbi:MAG TPA: LD-carboxypeptidase [Longimicrobiales bacterium]|nr:LD-carboxypeptidase [Longimicrobiales bacterium]
MDRETGRDGARAGGRRADGAGWGADGAGWGAADAGMSRRELLRAAAAGSVLLGCAPLAGATSATDYRLPATDYPPLKPPRLRSGQTVGLINPAGASYVSWDLEVVEESLAALGFRTVRGAHVLDRRGYFAGTDEERAADLNRMFADDAIDGILCVRGGWGSARILSLIDYDAVRAHPKVFVGYSDVTALLLAMHARTGLVGFHGPVGTATWNEFSVGWFRRVLMDAEAVTFANPIDVGDNLVQTSDRVQTITPGRARGRVLGGNLSVLTGIVGSGYLPDWDGAILFLEEIGEDIYRVDRMLTQLKLAGILDAVAGVVFGKCTDCDSGETYGSLTLEEVLDDHLQPLGVPAWYGAMIGHIADKWTVPVGTEVEIDADAGTVTMLEPAVV